MCPRTHTFHACGRLHMRLAAASQDVPRTVNLQSICFDIDILQSVGQFDPTIL